MVTLLLFDSSERLGTWNVRLYYITQNTTTLFVATILDIMTSRVLVADINIYVYCQERRSVTGSSHSHGGRRPVKVWNANRNVRKALVVGTYDEFLRKGKF